MDQTVHRPSKYEMGTPNGPQTIVNNGVLYP